MTETFTTQCPYCQTRFRLKHSQLNAARGAVRCGACLQVFNAVKQITEGSAPPAAPAPRAVTASTSSPNTAAPSQAKVAPKPFLIHDDMDLGDLDDIDLDAELARLEQEEQQRNQALSEDLAKQQALSTIDSEPTKEDESPRFDDWSDELLAQEPVAQLSSVVTDDPEQEESANPQSDGSSPNFSAPKEPVRMEPLPLGNQLPNFSDGPLRLDWQPKKSPWRRWLFWGALNLSAVVLLLGQYTYHNFAQLARQEQTRPWLERLCPIIHCQLPSKVDVSQIKSSNLLVRSHPEFSGALLVDAIIYNRASFAQPFPLLKLSFSDRNGQLLASRLFKPAEYLGGELAGQAQMPQQTPIHIALEVLEPNGGAINYSLDFVSPE